VRPYYEEAGIAIYHGDCREIVLPPVDAIVTDPPYGDTSLEWDRMVRGWMGLAEPVTSNIWCFGSFRMFAEMFRAGECSRWTLAQEIVWEKQNGSAFHADRFKRVHELAVQFYRGDWAGIYKSPVTTQDATAKVTRRKSRPTHTGHIENAPFVSHDGGPRLMRSVIEVRNCQGQAYHPTQKPVGIINPLLRYSVPDGGLVADLFAGSGSVLVAAKALGMRAIGIEINETYCEIAARRLSQGVLDLADIQERPQFNQEQL
jgi:site-specific DNA-methyltransferase (adenine-specific)